MNVRDYNGILSEKNTYYPWNLDEFIDKSKNLSKEIEQLNEVVFHDNIDMKYCCGIIGIFKKQIKINHFLPNISMENEEEPDMTKQPFFCYPFEDIYTGSDPLPKSSTKWYHMMSKVCDINESTDTDRPEDIIKKIKDKAYELYNNRDKQHISLLKHYRITSPENKYINSKSKSKRRIKGRQNRQKTFRKNDF
jgi:hypothetical protein